MLGSAPQGRVCPTAAGRRSAPQPPSLLRVSSVLRGRGDPVEEKLGESKRAGTHDAGTHDALIELYSSQISSQIKLLNATECEMIADSMENRRNCAAVGGAPNPDFCKETGFFCKQLIASLQTAFGSCNGTCPVTEWDSKKQCCSDYVKAIEHVCTGVNKSSMDAMVRILLDACMHAPARARSPCFEHNNTPH